VPVVNESALELRVPAHLAAREMEMSQALDALAADDIREFYHLPSGYPTQNVVERVIGPGRSAAFEDLQRRSLQEQVLAQILRSSLLAQQDLPADVAARLLRPVEVREETADGTPPPAGFEAGFLLPYAFTFLFVMSIFITSGYLLQSVTEEKENRVVEILLSSVPPLPLMTGKIIGLGAAGLTQVVVWVGAALVALPLISEQVPFLQGLQINLVSLVLAMVYFALGYLAYGAIFAAIGALAPGTREAQQYSGFFGFFAVIPLIFASVFLADPGSPVVTALALFPLTAPAAMLQVLALSPQPPLLLVAGSLTSLGLFAALAAVAASRIFRATLLLYGVRPSLRRIAAAVTAGD
jgi:ABC-2 type transport system permease protein